MRTWQGPRDGDRQRPTRNCKKSVLDLPRGPRPRPLRWHLESRFAINTDSFRDVPMLDLTFIIPIRVDTPDRIENCRAVLRFLLGNFAQAEIQIVEQDSQIRTTELRTDFPNVRWRFDFNAGRFCKSAALNAGLRASDRSFACTYDADVLIDPRAMKRALALLRTGEHAIVIPYNFLCIDVAGSWREKVILDQDIGRLATIRSLARAPRGSGIGARVLSGGVVVFDRAIVLAEGGYNRKMVSYGWEDTEFISRFEKLGYFAPSLRDFSLIHLDHRRGEDSQINEHYTSNKQEYERVRRLSIRALRRYIDEELLSDGVEDPVSRARRRSELDRRNALGIRRVAHRAAIAGAKVGVYGIANLSSRIFGGG